MNVSTNFDSGLLTDLNIFQLNDIIFQCRDEIARKSTIKDVLDNQNYNTLRLASVMEHVDPSLEVCLDKRNGVDYYFNSCSAIETGEMKAFKAKHLTSLGQWSFHALAVLDNGDEDNFLLYSHYNGQPLRIYDVRDPSKVKAINHEISALAQSFKAAVLNGSKSGKFDIISLKEVFVQNLFHSHSLLEYRDGDIRRTNRSDIMVGQQFGTVSIYSDAGLTV